LEVEADHVAIVEVPANKQCRIVEFSAEGGHGNRMTWRVRPLKENEAETDGEEGLTANALLATATEFGARRELDETTVAN
jgi:hypothetical protein